MTYGEYSQFFFMFCHVTNSNFYFGGFYQIDQHKIVLVCDVKGKLEMVFKTNQSWEIQLLGKQLCVGLLHKIPEKYNKSCWVYQKKKHCIY